MAKTEGVPQPIQQFTHDVKVVINTEVSFERHLAKQLPARNYLPMALDLNGIEELGPQAVPLLFMMIDVLYAFQSKVHMAAKELLGLHLAGLDEHAPLLYSRVISSYLLSLREDELADPQATSKSSNSPCPIIFYVQLANKLHKAFENQNVTIGYKFLQQLEACIVNSGSIDMTRFSQFHILLYS